MASGVTVFRCPRTAGFQFRPKWSPTAHPGPGLRAANPVSDPGTIPGGGAQTSPGSDGGETSWPSGRPRPGRTCFVFFRQVPLHVCVCGRVLSHMCVCVDKCFRMCVSSAQGWRWDGEHRCWHGPEAQAGGGHSRPRVVVCVCVGLLQAILLNYNSINVYATGRGEPAFRLSVCSVVPVSDACCMMCGLLRAGPSIFPASSVVRMSIW